jgi:putative ABC transport system permease protein
MIKNYLKTAWRNIVNNKFYTAINVVGLTVGLVVGLFMLLWVQDELSFDRFNKNAPNIYKIGIVGGTGPTEQVFTGIIAPVATFAKKELPDVKDAVRIRDVGQLPFKFGDKVITANTAFTDPSFFSVFDFPLIKGSPQKPFADNNSVVITESTAKKFFGDNNPIGKVIELAGQNMLFKITGVINDFPANSSIKFDVFEPLSLFNQMAYVQNVTKYNGTGRIPSMDADWISFNYDTYLLVKPGADIMKLRTDLRRIHERNRPEDAPVPYLAQPLLQMHLYKPEGGDAGIGTVKIFAIVAILILIIACINYVNLSTARSMLRAKEVSMRKIIGAGKWQLFVQFMVETTLMFLIATALAIGLMVLLLPAYNNFSGKQMVLALSNYQVWFYIALTLFCTLAASSIYPALLLSSLEPLKALKGKITAGIGSASFRRVLVVVQFTVSIMLIIGTLIIGNQLKYIRNKNLVYDKENVFSFNMSRDMEKHYDAVKSELLKQPGITAISRSGDNIVDYDNWTGDNDWTGKPANSNLLFHPMLVDKGFIEFFKIKMLQGAAFTGSPADSAHFIVNEAAVKAMGLTNPIGTKMRVWSIKGNISGVMQDFHYMSMRKKIEPAVFMYIPDGSWKMYIKTTGKDVQSALAATQQQWKQYNNNLPFNYTFLDENFSQLYKSEEQTGSLFNMFASIAVIISCLGLFGLATYSAQVKTREIGIRKVLGASIPGIVKLLAAEFMLLIIIAIVIAVPVAWYAMGKWLQDFAYRIDVTWPVFAIAGITAVFIAFITISFQSIKAAVANPVKSLRSE